MTTFSKVQNSIPANDCILRQHAIPLDVRQFAGGLQLGFSGKRGRGRANVPTLADIYYTLMKEGYQLIRLGAAVPVFNEIGQPDGCTFTRIKFDTAFDSDLRDLKERAEHGEFVVKPYKEISLISVAVTLMQVAIAARQTDTPTEAQALPAKASKKLKATP